MNGLAIVVATADAVRFRAALGMAAAYAALGGRTRVLLDGEAVSLVASPAEPMLDSCWELGVTITLCQSGLALAGLESGMLDPRFDYGGMVGLLAELGEDRLLLA